MSFKDISLFAKICAVIGAVIYFASGTAFFFTVITFIFLAPLAFEVFTDRSPKKKKFVIAITVISTAILLGFMPILYFFDVNPFAPMNSTIVLILCDITYIIVCVLMNWLFPRHSSVQSGKTNQKKEKIKRHSSHLRSVS